MPLFSYPTPLPRDYRSALPFPHAVHDAAWDRELLELCLTDVAAFRDWDGEKDFHGSRLKRYCGDITVLPGSVRAVIQEASEPRFLSWLEELTGEHALVPDPYLQGGGIHSTGRGGFLEIHADFNWHERLQLYRRLNVLIYLNGVWDPEWGGELELFSDPAGTPEVSLAPVLGRMVTFTTDDASFHGHRHPLACPPEVRRNSIALYYYSPIKPHDNYASARTKTNYRAAAAERLRRTLSLRERARLIKDAARGYTMG